MLGLQRMTEPSFGEEPVPVAPTHPGDRDVPVGGKVSDDLLRRSFGDAYPSGDVSQPDVGVARDAQQDVGVIGEKRPGAAGHPADGSNVARQASDLSAARSEAT